MESSPVLWHMPGYSYIWEFDVAPSRIAEFEQHYGPHGTWVRLFEKAPGYLGTTLLRDRARPQRYVTIDSWESIEAYRAFRSGYASQYEEIDKLCANLTTREASMGEFAGFAPNSPLEHNCDP